MDSFTILAGTTLLLTVLCVVFAVFLWTVSAQNKVANRLLGTDLIVLAITISVFWYHLVIDLPPKLDLFRDDIGLLNSVFSFLYIVAALTKDFKLRWRHLIHLISLTSLLLSHWSLYTASSSEEFFDIYNNSDHIGMRVGSCIQTFTAIVYISWGFVVLHQKKKLILENYADDIIMVHKWLWQFNSYSLILFLVSFTKSILRDYLGGDAFNLIRIVMVFGLISFLIWIVLKALYHPKIFHGVDAKLLPVSSLVVAQSDTHRDQSSDEKAQEIKTIQKYMLAKKPFLDSSLSLHKLAKYVEMPPQELSLLINHHLGKHFFDFINEYRIKAAQKILADSNQKDKTVLEILYEVGFNSKSSFNTAFKKHTNMTPTQYRKSQR